MFLHLILHAGDRLVNRFTTAINEMKALQEEFDELETALEEANPGMIKRYRTLYEESGGEQFRPDPQKVKCMFLL